MSNYDNWLTSPYEDQAEKDAKEDWIEENTTYISACCSSPMPPEYAEEGEFFPCPSCHEMTKVIKTIPDPYDDY